MVQNKHVNRRTDVFVYRKTSGRFSKIWENVEAVFGVCDGAQGGTLFMSPHGNMPVRVYV